MGRGSWPPLLAAAVLFVAAFFGLRQRSTFLRIEADAAAAAALAAAHGLAPADVMALRDLLGVDVDAAALAAACATFARERGHLGDELAAVALAGDRAAATSARAAAPDAASAWVAFRSANAAVPGLRFVALRERFAARERPRG
jgi:hypothetical protein